MLPRIEDFTLLGRTHRAALVDDEGSIDWEDGRWQIAPYGQVRALRRYRGDTLVLETDFDTADGSIRLVDFMPPQSEVPRVVRLVEGVRGRVRMHMDLRVRVDGVWLQTQVETRDEGVAVRADFFVTAGELIPFVLTWHPSDEATPIPIDPFRALADAESYWTERFRVALIGKGT
jgi:hypothetical protein